MDKPTLQPSLLCEWPGFRCHSYMRDGYIAFCNDCTHKFSGVTLEIPDWEQEKSSQETTPMGEKHFKPGDQVKLLALHVIGITAEVVAIDPNGPFVCKITSSEHPSGHSQKGTLVMFPADQLELVASGIPKEVEL
jgi:hypothetical protein